MRSDNWGTRRADQASMRLENRGTPVALPTHDGVRPAQGAAAARPFSAVLGDRTPLSPAAALDALVAAYREVTGKTPNPRAVRLLWAQWALETGRGQSMRGYNFGGLKAAAGAERSAVLATHEGYGANRVAVAARFRTYATAEEGARDYVATLERDYPKALAAAEQGDARGFVHELASRRYFTGDPAAYQHAIESLARSPGEAALTTDAPAPLVDALLQTLARRIAARGD